MARGWIAAAFLLSITAGAQALTGADRASFIAGVIDVCMVGAKVTGAIPRQLWREYCECTANGVADRIPMNSVPDQAAIKAEAARCYANMREKLPTSPSP